MRISRTPPFKACANASKPPETPEIGVVPIVLTHKSELTTTLMRTISLVTSAAAKSVASDFTSASVLPERTDSPAKSNGLRSEEHTSELQSHSDLVCRL